jgi:hypothetical protein
MQAPSGTDVAEVRHRLEREAASLLGFMIFEYSRTEMDLGLVLAWADEGRSLEVNSKQIADLTFNERLERLRKAMKAKHANSPAAIDAYEAWLREAHAMRELRNSLFHGRWGMEVPKQVVVNVVGLPTHTQIATRYSISDLQALLERMRSLRKGLEDLRSRWPV